MRIVALGRPTWVVGPPLGGGPLDQCPAAVRTVYPEREPVRQLSPDAFNPLIEALRRAQGPPRS